MYANILFSLHFDSKEFGSNYDTQRNGVLLDEIFHSRASPVIVILRTL